jgi:hypothetical protein
LGGVTFFKSPDPFHSSFNYFVHLIHLNFQLCQSKLDLHPSLVTEGGEIAPLSNDIHEEPSTSSGLANIAAEPSSTDIQSFIADLVFMKIFSEFFQFLAVE